MFAKGAADVGKERIVGLKYDSCSNTKLQLLCDEWINVIHLRQLALKLGMKCDVSWPECPVLKVLIVDYFSHIGNLHIPLSLHSLTIDCISLQKQESDSIAKYLSESKCLKELTLKFCSDKLKMEPIARALATNHSLPLERLELSYDRSQVTKSAYMLLITFILNSTSLKQLSIMPSRVTQQKLEQLIQAAKQKCETEKTIIEDIGASPYYRLNHMVKKLKVKNIENFQFSTHFPQFPQFQPDHETRVIVYYQPFNELSIPHNRGVETANIGEVSNHSSGIQKVSLSYNLHKDVARVLHHNITLQMLTLSDTQICAEEATALAQALHVNSSLQNLTVSHIEISRDGVAAIGSALHENTGLQVLTIFHTIIGDDAAKLLANSLSHNSTLRELTLSYAGVANEGTEALANALCKNCTLKKLTFLSHSYIAIDEGCAALAQALSHNSSLQELDLHSNNIPFSVTRQFAQFLTQNTSITNNGGCSGLTLPRRCKEYAIMCPEYHKIKHKINFE